jgi:hypothetical protein
LAAALILNVQLKLQCNGNQLSIALADAADQSK